MSTITVRSGHDVWVNQAKKSTNYVNAKAMHVKTGAEFGFLYVANSLRKGSTVTRATLTLYAKGASSGQRTLTVQRVAESWREGRVNWQNKPGVSGASATASVGALKDRQAVTIDVTNIVQATVSGAANFGMRLTTSAANRHAFYGFSSAHKPVLSVTWSDAPTKPQNLVPSEAAVGSALPHVSFSASDYGGKGITLVRVQVLNEAGALVLDTGDVASTAQSLDLSQFANKWAGMAEGETVRWRVMVRDGDGLPSPWSDYHTMSRVAKGVVTITNLDAGKAFDSTPPITWTFSKTQRAFQVVVYKQSNPTKVIFDSRTVASAEKEFTIPKEAGLADNVGYTVEVRCWDEIVREAATGDDTYAYVRADFFLDTDAAVASPTALKASRVVETPWVDLTWSRTTMPDEFVVYRDGIEVGRFDGPDLFVSGTSYVWRYLGARPNREHVYTVKAVVNGRASKPSAGAALTTSPAGLWLVDTEENVSVTLWGNEDGTWNMTDEAEIYTPVGSSEPVRIINALRGLEGSLSGLLMDGFGKTFEQAEADLYTIKSNPTSRFRLVAGDENFEALIGNVKVSPKPETREGRIVKAVSFDFWQVGDLPFSL